MRPKISVLLINYDSQDLMLMSLRSLFPDGVPDNTEVLVVDNASKEGLPLKVVQEFPRTRLFISEENLGFAKAANFGIRESRGKYVILVNPDTLGRADTVDKLVRFMDDHPEAAGVAPQAYYMTGEFQPVARRFITIGYVFFGRRSAFHRLMPNNPFTRRYLYLDIEGATEPIEVEAVIGAFVCFRRKAFLEVGGFDERFFFYAEDIDLCKRLQEKNWRLFLLPDAKIIHLYGGSRRKIHLFSEYHRMKAFYKFFSKHFWQLRLGNPMLGLGLVGMVGAMMFSALFGAEPKEPSWIRDRKRKK